MSDANRAYKAAIRLIAKAKKSGAVELALSDRSLQTLPPQIAELSTLRVLSLRGTKISDLSPISGLSELTELEAGAYDKRRTDIGPLSYLINLRRLHVDYASADDLSALASLVKLRSLSLSRASLKRPVNLAGLQNLIELSKLSLTEIRNLDDISPLAALMKLTELDLSYSYVSDLRPLRGLSRLAEAPTGNGLRFGFTTAAMQDAKIREISGIQDNATRAKTLFAYLKDWEPPGEVVGPEPAPEIVPQSFFFLSYASPNRSLIAEMRAFLMWSGVPIWWDQDIPAGATWRAEIAEQLRAARAVITFWTKESVASKAVIEEASTAQAAGRLVHVRLEDATLPYGFGETQYVDLRDWDGTPEHPQIRKLLQALQDKLKAPPGLPERIPAPLEIEVVEGRLRLESTTTGLLTGGAATRAEQGWHALKDYRESFGESFNVGNYAPLPSVLKSFDRALGETYNPTRQIALGMHGQRIIGLAYDADFVVNLPTGAKTELRGFAAAIATLVNRFPDWILYQEEAEASDPAAQKAIAERLSFEEIDAVISAADHADAEVKAEYHDEVVAGTDAGASEIEAKGLVASTGEVARVLLEAGIAEAKSGKAARNFGKQMEDMHQKEFPKLVYYAGGLVLPMLSRMSKPLRRLAVRYPKRLGFVVAALDYLFGPENGAQ